MLPIPPFRGTSIPTIDKILHPPRVGTFPEASKFADAFAAAAKAMAAATVVLENLDQFTGDVDV